jgi:hypothetical protein
VSCGDSHGYHFALFRRHRRWRKGYASHILLLKECRYVKQAGLERLAPDIPFADYGTVKAILKLNAAGRRYLIKDRSSISKGVDVLNAVSDEIDACSYTCSKIQGCVTEGPPRPRQVVDDRLPILTNPGIKASTLTSRKQPWSPRSIQGGLLAFPQRVK